MATALLVAVAQASEPAPTLLGATREQVVRKMGEPRSQIAVGSRLVMLYARERVVLRDGVVVDVERIVAEPVRRATPAPAPAPTPAPAPAAPSAGTGADQLSAAVPTVVNPAAAAPAAVSPAPMPPTPAPVPVMVIPGNPENVVPPPQDPTAAAPKIESPSVPAPEPKMEIKLVRPPSAGAPRPASRPLPAVALAPAVAAPAPVAPAPPVQISVPTVPPPRAEVPSPAPAASPAAAPVGATRAADAAPAVASSGSRPANVAESSPASASPVAAEETASDDEKAKRAKELTAAADAAKKAKVDQAVRRRLAASSDDSTPDPTPNIFSTRTYVISFVTVFGGVGYLIWRRRQRQLELDATAVSQTPFDAPSAGPDGGGGQVAPSVIAKLEWKRFEELVEAYYSKTGVVAARTKGGPLVPAQIKISWKGEPRPFALVRCISQVSGLIEVKPLQELYTLLATEDIRRGYVVTTGKFSVAARDYAEEKHLTLLPGDIFLEKLNALPGTARDEILQAATAGDSSTPSCPACEAKMTRSNDHPPVWRCASHADVTFPVRD